MVIFLTGGRRGQFEARLGIFEKSWQMALADKNLIKPSVYALFAGLGIISAGQGSVGWLIAGVTLGILVATPFIIFATSISTYMVIAYHTCLYLWAREVERACFAGQAGNVNAPSPLAAMLQ